GHWKRPTHNRALQIAAGYQLQWPAPTPAPAPAPAADGCITNHCRTDSLEKLILVLIIFIHCRKGSLEKFVLNLLLNMQFPSIEGMNRSALSPPRGVEPV
ncbi:hypothetical protein, partial [Thiolapillus sp.]|uniref:hypothetical protein n=1 Tax=Thiolapillus sp. TaxID=2017437 RepID=UPI003AF80025